MTRFFWRIFLSAWAIVLVATTLTLWAARLVPSDGPEPGGSRFTVQMTTLIADELRQRLASDPAGAVDSLVADYVLDFSPVLEIYLLDPDGEDVLGRALPSAIARYIASHGQPSSGAPGEEHSQLHLRSDGLEGYLVVGLEGFFPVGRTLIKPGVRWMLLAFALLVSAAVSLMLTRFIVLPVRRLQLAGQQVATGDLNVRVAHTVGSRTDEIARLAHDFDRMTERVQTLLESRQRLMRDVSHELRSPLARLQALVSIASQRADNGGATQIERMEREIERLDGLIGEILLYSRLEALDHVSRHPTDIVELVKEVVDAAEFEARGSGKRMQLVAPDRLVMLADSALMQRAVENVVRNAVKFTGEGSAVTVRVGADAGMVRITVDDEGPGVPADEIDRIFEPFYRVGDSRSTQAGTGGIGLAIALRSIRLHGGSISARNRGGGGLRVEIELPIAP